MINLGSRSIAQLAMLEYASRKLGDLNNDFIFLGGCAAALFITDPASPDVRSTMDVDCIVDVLSLNDYYKLEKRLKMQGFRKSEDLICRWHYDDLILDVMPTEEKILGFSNRWYKEAITNFTTHKLTEDIAIRSVTAPYFLGTKLEAFKARGRNDFMNSHDFEDIIAVIDGRIELIEEVKSTSPTLRAYLSEIFSKMLLNDDFQTEVYSYCGN
jgi:predicted nucleotidyltransferase